MLTFAHYYVILSLYSTLLCVDVTAPVKEDKENGLRPTKTHPCTARKTKGAAVENTYRRG